MGAARGSRYTCSPDTDGHAVRHERAARISRGQRDPGRHPGAGGPGARRRAGGRRPAAVRRARGHRRAPAARRARRLLREPAAAHPGPGPHEGRRGRRGAAQARPRARRRLDVRVAPPGFLNFYLAPGWVAAQAEAIATAGDAYATSDLGAGKRVQIEYVSANPTGPIHVGNGRGAAIGSTLANVMRAAGYDGRAGVLRQRRRARRSRSSVAPSTRGTSSCSAARSTIPENGYPGAYVIDVARGIKERVGDRFLSPRARSPTRSSAASASRSWSTDDPRRPRG